MNKRELQEYWYMRLHNKIFYDKGIIEIECLSEGKYDAFFPSFIIHLYFKLMCYSIESNGLIYFDYTFEENEDIAYSIATRLFSPSKVSDVRRALIILQEKGLVEVEKDVEIKEGRTGSKVFIPSVVDNTGKTTLGSEQKRKRRIAARQGDFEQLMLPTEDVKVRKYGRLKNVNLTKDEYEKLKIYSNFETVLNNYSFQIVARKEDYNYSDYEILQNLIEGNKNHEQKRQMVETK